MQSIRLASTFTTRTWRSRQRATITKICWKLGKEPSKLCNHVVLGQNHIYTALWTRSVTYVRTEERKESFLGVCPYVIERKARSLRLSCTSSHRTFSTTSDGRGKVGTPFCEELDNKTESILVFLKNQRAFPVGSMTPSAIKDAIDALDYWVSAAASLPRKRKHLRESNRHDLHNRKEYKNCFENARFLIARLAQEQSYYYEHPAIVSTPDTTTMELDSDVYDVIEEEQKQGRDCNYIGSGDDHSFVQPFLLNRVVDCWRIGWRDGRLDYTPNDIMAWVENLNHSNGLELSDNRTLTMIVDGICLRGDPYEAPLLAQWLLDRRLGDAYEDEEDVSLRPDTIFLTNVIRAWAKSGRIEAPEMADGLLKTMHELYSKSGWTESAPNAFSYSATMEAWSRSERPDSTKRIEELLEEMKNSNLVQVVPDRVSYQYLLNAWANSKSLVGAEKAYDVLQEMIALFEAGNVLVAPNSANFSRVMMALARNGKDERVETLLGQLQHLYSGTGDPSFQPTDECWKACIIAKAKSGGVAEAQGLLDGLVERALSSNNKMLMPRRSYFVDTLVAWTKEKDQMVAAEMSQKVLDRMVELAREDESYRHLSPDAKSYEKVILAWSRSRHNGAPERVQELLTQMEEQFQFGNQKMQTSLAGYTNLMLAWHRSGRKESVYSIQNVFDNLQLRCSASIESHLRPDKYVFGILLESWARQKDLAKAESVFEEMIKEWRNGNSGARPDIHIFHKILKACSQMNQNDGCPAEKCEQYFTLMSQIGLPATVLVYSCLIDAISKKRNATTADVNRASALLDELLENVSKGTTRHPSNHREYRDFLHTIANSCIPKRNQQAKQILDSLPGNKSLRKTPLPKELLPSV